MGVGDIDFGENMVKRPRMLHWWTAMHHDNNGPLAPKEVNKELEEGVDRKCLQVLVLAS